MKPHHPMASVIISVPHAHCTFRSHQFRHCDLLALPFASSIKKYLEEQCIPVKIFASTELRSTVDMNRLEGRGTPFRNDLDTEMERALPGTILLDVHSAPHDTLDGHFDVYVLDMYNDDRDDLFNSTLVDHLRSSGYKVYHLDGARKNDIIHRALNDFGLKNVSLIEVNESMHREMMEILAASIASFIVLFTEDGCT